MISSLSSQIYFTLALNCVAHNAVSSLLHASTFRNEKFVTTTSAAVAASVEVSELKKLM
jgi:hypothetical protein